jgi:hypothetical protein
MLAGLDTSNIGANRPTTVFDGISVTVFNDTTILPIPEQTDWVVTHNNLNLNVTPDNTSRGLPWPNDYLIEFYDTPQDTGYINAPAQLYIKMPVNFKITNLYTGQQAKFATRDIDASGTLTIGDEIQILEFIGAVSVSNSRIAWIITYNGPTNPITTPILPVAGDKFQIKISKPFYDGDYFSFAIKPSTVDNNKAKDQLSNISVVPNPYLGAATWERKNLNYTGRGERKIEFVNLPAKCEVRIYTMAGALIKTLYKDTSPVDGSLFWNLVTEDGLDIAYGVYIYHVKADGIGESIGKFAVIK